LKLPIGALLLQSSVRGEFELLFWSMVVLCGLVGTGIAVCLLYFVWRYRRRESDELPPQIKLNIPAEVTWITLPFLIFMAMFFFGAKLYFNVERPPDNAEQIYVVAKQWMWKLQHAGGQREINTLHVPVGQPIRLNLISQDAIHSFFVPAFRIKQDVLPSRYTSIWFEAERPGTYHLFCTQYCGTDHSQMIGWVYAMQPADYQRWLEQGAAEGSLASTGEKLFHQYGCSNCHRLDTQGRCPNLRGIYNRPVEINGGKIVMADESYLRESILQPMAKIVYGYQPIMPTFQLKEEEVIALIAYIKALGAAPGTQMPSAPGQLPAGFAGQPGIAGPGMPPLYGPSPGER
jgi:cytochrome c oxidase subunit II